MLNKFLSACKWTFIKYFFTGRMYDLMPEEREHARLLMSEGIFLWVSRRNTHLTTYLISIGDYLLSAKAWILSGCRKNKPRFGFWSHAFFNFDDNEIVEAVSKGVQRHYFDSVFDCDSVCALVPRNMSKEEWDSYKVEISRELLNQIGKKYDNIFDIYDDSRLTCIELVRLVLKNKIPGYNLKFSNFENMIDIYKNVTPQMLYDCKDFKIVWEVRKK